MNIYVPPIHRGSNDSRRQLFSADRTFLPFLQGVESAADSIGLIVAGDINAHALEWDIYSHEDGIGLDIIDFLDGNGFTVWNDGLPTYHVAILVLLRTLRSRLVIWRYKTGHTNLLLANAITTPYRMRSTLTQSAAPFLHRRRTNVYRTSISWRKVDWSTFNNEVQYLLSLADTSAPEPYTRAHVHYLSKRLTNAFDFASKSLPRGCRPDPISWYTPELDLLFQAREQAWNLAKATNTPDDWQIFRTDCTRGPSCIT